MKIIEENMAKCPVVYKNDRFIIKDHNFDTQYYPYYNSRREQMKNFIKDTVDHKWGSDVNILSLQNLAERSEQQAANDKVIIFGVLFKKATNQPSILKEISDDNPVLGQPLPEKYISDEDTLWLQSDNETIEVLRLDVHNHCTGICVALKGVEDESRSAFLVEDVCYASIWSEQMTIDKPIAPKDQYIALVSGLGFSKFMKDNQSLTKALNIMIDILKGNSEFAKNKSIARLIIAGNAIGTDARKQEVDNELDKKLPLWNQKIRAQTLHAIALFDAFLARLGQFIPIDFMPGSLDPTTQFWPQQPLHPCIFKKAFSLSSVKCVTNPHLAEYNGIELLGTSGQNINSIREYTKMNDSIEIMRKTMEWLHLAPTCPDTMLSYPFNTTDPFVITNYPDVYFAGNQKEFNTGSFDAPNGKKVLLISVPKFEDKMVCVLLNTTSLKCDIIALD